MILPAAAVHARRCSLALLFLFLTASLQAEVIERSMQVRGTSFRYEVVLPSNYDPSKTYPAILAFGGGAENMNSVDAVLNRYLRAEAERRGYIVVAPAAPDDQLILWYGAELFPEFLDKILADYKIENRKFHVAGPSNGGIAALEAAAAHPDYFLSVTGFPGYLVEPPDKKLKAISKMCGLMSVIGALTTAVELEIPVVWVLFNNFCFSTIRSVGETYFKNTYGTEFTRGDGTPYNPDFQLLAKSFGMKSYLVEEPNSIASVVTEALALNVPCLVEVRTRGDVPMPRTGYWDIADFLKLGNY